MQLKLQVVKIVELRDVWSEFCIYVIGRMEDKLMMKEFLKRIRASILWRIRANILGRFYPSLYMLRTSSALHEDGWFRSNKEKASVDLHGEPIPWFTYPAFDFLKKHLPANISVFEYGCGAGTLWWAARAKEVVACEHNLEWYKKISAECPQNVKILYANLEYGGEYSKTITKYQNKFDIVVIDGRDRVNCAKNCLSSLTEKGVIIFDDSDRKQYQDGYDYLLAHGFKRIEFMGIGPGLTFKFETSIFYRPNNIFGI